VARLHLVPGTLCDERVFGAMLYGFAEANPAGRIRCPEVALEAERRLADVTEPVVAVGFSLGGFVVLEMVRRFGHRLKAAVLVASNALPLRGSPEDRRSDIELFRNRGAQAVIARHWGSYVAPARAGNAALRSLVERMALDTPPADFAAQVELAISRPDSRSVVAATSVPVLIVDGELDRMSPPGGNSGLVKPPAVERVSIAGSGHFVPLEAPREAGAAIASFLVRSGACC
jgi:pimeloyl-ACP methyl ester carboxylesterase